MEDIESVIEAKWWLNHRKPRAIIMEFLFKKSSSQPNQELDQA
jgi:hypothetical protein